MAVVQLSIGGQKYSVSCGAGQEDTLNALALMLDEKVRQVKARAPVGESMGLVMGALLLAGDLSDRNQQLVARQQENAVSPETIAATAELTEKMAERISGVAELIENA